MDRVRRDDGLGRIRIESLVAAIGAGVAVDYQIPLS